MTNFLAETGDIVWTVVTICGFLVAGSVALFVQRAGKRMDRIHAKYNALRHAYVEFGGAALTFEHSARHFVTQSEIARKANLGKAFVLEQMKVEIPRLTEGQTALGLAISGVCVWDRDERRIDQCRELLQHLSEYFSKECAAIKAGTTDPSKPLHGSVNIPAMLERIGKELHLEEEEACGTEL